jgi:flagellin
MGLRINQNIAAMNSYRNLSVTDGQMSKSLEKLSSGFRINRAADDAAGLSISEGLRAQIGGLKVAVRNSQDAISVVQTAEGALGEVHSILQRMRDLSVQASSGGSQDTEARSAANSEFAKLNEELDRIGNTTSYGKTKLLDGTFGGTPATVAGALTGQQAGHVTSAVAANFTIDGIFGTGTIGAAVDVDLAASATYATASEYQTAMQTAIDTAMSASADVALGTYQAGDVKATVSDAGNGVWNVSLSSARMTSLIIGDGAEAATLSGLVAATAAGTSGSGGVFQVGANNSTNEQITVSISKISTAAADLNTSTSTLTTTAGAQAAVTVLDAAITKVSDQRANLGAFQNRFEHTINNLNVAVENLSASESRIRDTDMAVEMVAFTRSQILSQAGTAMLAQANQAPQSVLSLLR